MTAHAASPERLVLFTDAVAAIAITLLILPLLEALAHIADLGGLIREHLPGFGAFLLGFVVIFRFWWGHHRVFGHLSRLRGPIEVVAGSLATFGALLLSAVVGVAFPQINYWALLLLFLSEPAERLFRSRRRRAQPRA